MFVFRGASRSFIATSLAVAASAVFMAGCGSSDSDSGSAAPAAAGSSDATAAATKAVEPYLTPTDSIGITDKLSKTPPAGKNVASVQCNLPVCKRGFDGIEAAAKTLGWSFKSFVSTGAPEDVLKQIDAALATKPDGLLLNGFSDATIQSGLDKAKAAGVPVVNAGVPDEVKAPVIAIPTNTPVFQRDGKILGDWVTSDSNGAANIVWVNVPLFPILDSLTKAFTDQVKAACPDCKVKVVNAQATDAGTKLPTNVVSELQADPDANYVGFVDGNFAAGVPAALKSAGLTDKVKVFGQAGSAPNLQNVVNGTEAGWLSYPVEWISWAQVDALARHLVGDDPVQSPTAQPTFMQVKSDTTSAAAWNPANYQASFEQLWGVGS